MCAVIVRDGEVFLFFFSCLEMSKRSVPLEANVELEELPRRVRRLVATSLVAWVREDGGAVVLRVAAPRRAPLFRVAVESDPRARGLSRSEQASAARVMASVADAAMGSAAWPALIVQPPCRVTVTLAGQRAMEKVGLGG